MDLEKLQQEAEALKNIDASQLSPEQLAELISKVSSILTQSEESLINSTFIETNTLDNEDNK